MRIAIVGTELCAVDSRGGGLEQVLLRWGRHLATDHDVVVVSHRAPRPIRDLDVVSVEGTHDLRRALRRLQPDLVSFHNRPHWVALAPPGARGAVTFHNYPGAWKLPARQRIAEDVAASAVSGALAFAARALLDRDVAVTPPSIAPEFLTEPARHPTSEVLFPNRLLEKKGVRDLLAVARRPELAMVRFAFADLISPWTRPTAEHRALRDAIDELPNATRFPPIHGAAELAERYWRTGVVACPVTEDEGLGLVALEAQACAAALVTVDRGGLREATFSPNACLPGGDPDALAAALVDALERHPDCSAGPRAEVLARYSPASSGRAFGAWLERVLG